MLVIQRPTVEALGEAEGNRQRFAIGPLKPGFGHTLGNSLRRTLLSSIPGAAITQVRFDDALHEFDTIAGVSEDVTDIILNLKDIVIRSHSDEPVTLRLDARGPAEVTAALIQKHADIEVLNEDQHIASLNAKGRLAVDITIAARDGAELDMGTPFDDLTDLSHPALEEHFLANGQLSAAQLANRQLLRDVMGAAGWQGISREWWHFDGGDRERIRADFVRVL